MSNGSTLPSPDGRPPSPGKGWHPILAIMVGVLILLPGLGLANSPGLPTVARFMGMGMLWAAGSLFILAGVGMIRWSRQVADVEAWPRPFWVWWYGSEAEMVARFRARATFKGALIILFGCMWLLVPLLLLAKSTGE